VSRFYLKDRIYYVIDFILGGCVSLEEDIVIEEAKFIHRRGHDIHCGDQFSLEGLKLSCGIRILICRGRIY
jgi:hypothetical protein